jgi:hypothetical protein
MRPRIVLAAAIAACLLLPASASAAGTAPCASITDQLSTGSSSIEFTCLPEGTQHIGLAVMQNMAGAGLKYVSIPPTQKVYTPPAGLPVVDAQAWTATKAIGDWAGRKQTVPAGEKEVPVESPGPEHPAFLTGLNAGGWGASTEVPDLLQLGKLVRLDSPSGSLSAYESKGVKVIADMSGPYGSGGVSGVNVSSYVERDVKLVRSNPHLFALETLNEPGGNWFWGSSSESTANREAYGRLVVAVHDALVANFGANRPLQLCSADGGHDSSDAWLEGWSKVPGALEACDELTNHPYGGTGERAKASLGNRALVERTIAIAHKPVAVTEIGFPTKGPTGDSLQYTERQEATSVYNFVAWARSKSPSVALVTIYGYRDEREGGGYGVELHNGARKLAFTALGEVAAAQPCTVCE